MSLYCGYQKGTYKEQNSINTLSVKNKFCTRTARFPFGARGISRCTCMKGSLTVEAAVVMPFLACFIVFILYIFRILQVQAGVAQSLQYTGRRLAAEYSTQEAGREGFNMDTAAGLVKAKVYFQKQLEKQGCPTQYVNHGVSGIHFLQSDLSGNYVELKATYKMKFPVGLLGNIQYPVAQGIKSRKWTGYRPGEDDTREKDIWLYYTEHGTVYHASRTCSHLDLSIRGIPYGQVDEKRNHSGGKYHPCEKCGNSPPGGTVYITDYGNRYHTGLTCSGLKRTVYMIRKSEATDKRMCKKCGK